MNTAVSRRTLFSSASVVSNAPRYKQLGRHLVDRGHITSAELVDALEMQLGAQVPLGEILVARGLVTPAVIADIVAEQAGLYRADLRREPPDAALVDLAPAEFWLRRRAVPWMQLDGAVAVAVPFPQDLGDIAVHLDCPGEAVFPVIADADDILAAVSRLRAHDLAERTMTRLPGALSCRDVQLSARLPVMIACAVLLLCMIAAFPGASMAGLTLFSLAMLLLITALKLAGLMAQILHPRAPPTADRADAPGRQPRRCKRPVVSVLVPLFHETEIATALVRRIRRISYPHALLDVVLVLEQKDAMTRETLARTDLPPWMRIVEVPGSGELTTKPRALNYALDFCRGEIIGIWDAEDAPAPDQIDRVVDGFAAAPPDVVCLQGRLDFYNPRQNWLARCFTIEYASWWRIILPGIARLGLIIPLGGTTLFIRRTALEELGRWDAHNVTEDADLGVRIARFGYRTGIVDTATGEEANCRPLRWIKQRSRWIKGFMITYLVHMRAPRALLRDVGWRRFLGFQAFFVGTISQFVFAPLLWTFWVIPLGLPHPVQPYIGTGGTAAIAALFLFSEATNIAIGLIAVSGRRHRFLLPYVFTMALYFPLGALASYKAAFELLRAPFYWDKTTHGLANAENKESIV